MILAPKLPIQRPPKPLIIVLISGRKIIERYIIMCIKIIKLDKRVIICDFIGSFSRAYLNAGTSSVAYLGLIEISNRTRPDFTLQNQ